MLILRNSLDRLGKSGYMFIIATFMTALAQQLAGAT
jgi:hypothetical protein